MKRTQLMMIVWHYLPVIPVALYHIVAELISDFAHYFLGRRRAVRWPEPTSASSLLPSTY